MLNCRITRPIECTLYHVEEPKKVLIYLHSFSGSKLEGKALVPYVLPHFSLLVFDFIGCGNSKGGHVTLGIKESEDLRMIVNTLTQVFKTEEIFLWGRSMGAVTMIHYLNYLEKLRTDIEFKYEQLNKMHEYRKSIDGSTKFVEGKIKDGFKHIKTLKMSCRALYIIKGAVFDSPFSDANELVKGIIKRQVSSDLISDMTLFYITNNIRNNIGVDVLKRNVPHKKVDIIKFPALFTIGDQDDMVCRKGFNKMFEKYGGENKKLRVLVNTDHVDCRNDVDIEFKVNFLKKISKEVVKNKGNMNFSINFKYEEMDEKIMKSFIKTKSKVLKRKGTLTEKNKVIK